MSDPQSPLFGIRVIDAGTFIAAPFAASVLGEFGAEVIKVEQPESGDPLRRFGVPVESDGAEATETYCWLSEARNKRSITLDLKSETGGDLFRRLITKSDVLCENFRPGTLEKWGLGWTDLHALNPMLIMLRISGYGQSGPYRDRPGFARIAHAFGGLAHLTGLPGGPPLTPGSTSLADYMSGIYGVVGLLIALRQRDHSGVGQMVDLALYEPVLRVLDDLAPAYAAKGIGRDRLGMGTTNACPHGHFETSDGHWIAIACTSDKMFSRFAGMIGRPDLATSETYGRAAKRIANSGFIDDIVAEWVGSMPRQDVVDDCLAHQVPCAPINTIADIFADEHYAARGNLRTIHDPTHGDVVVPDSIPRLSESPGRIDSLGPALGEANDDIYGGVLGLSTEEITALRDKGVI